MNNNNKLKQLNLSSEAMQVLMSEPQLLDYLLKEKQKFPLPPNYIPLKIEIEFNGEIHYRSNCGRTLLARETPPTLNYMRWYFDDECVLFQIGSDLAIDRLENLKSIEELSPYIALND